MEVDIQNTETTQMDHFSVIEKVKRWVEGRDIVFVIASTTGKTVENFLPLIDKERQKIIVVTPSRLFYKKGVQFDPKIRKQLEDFGCKIVQETYRSAIMRILSSFMSRLRIVPIGYRQKIWEESLGIGGRVCFQIVEMAIKENLINKNEIVVALAGKTKGYNTALALKVLTTHPPRLALLDIITRPEASFD